MKALLLLYIGIFFCINTEAQTAQIEFYAEEPTTVYIFEPLDNAYNYQYATDTLYLKPNLKIEYTVRVADFNFTAINIPRLGRFVLPLISGNKLQLKIKGNELSFSGDNAAGLIYFNNEFIKKGLASYMEIIETTFDKFRTSTPYSQLYQLCLNEATNDIYENMDSLCVTQQISKRFSEIIKANLDYAFSFIIINKYRLTQEKSPQESIDIESAIDNVYSSCTINAPNILMYNYASSYVSHYYERKAFEKDKDFDTYSFLLNSPPHILLPCIGRALLIDILYSVKSFNHEKVYAYLASHFPDSDYVRILKPLFVNVESNEMAEETDSIEYITSTISRLEELSKLEQFKGKYILVDLWATWCTPCKLEFQYASVVDDILKQYSNLCLLYISIDEDRFYEHWKKTINNLHLYGTHLRVDNENLYQDIVNKIYLKEKVTIPKYILLSPDGEVINANLPRPSSQLKLKEAVSKSIR